MIFSFSSTTRNRTAVGHTTSRVYASVFSERASAEVPSAVTRTRLASSRRIGRIVAGRGPGGQFLAGDVPGRHVLARGLEVGERHPRRGEGERAHADVPGDLQEVLRDRVRERLRVQLAGL